MPIISQLIKTTMSKSLTSTMKRVVSQCLREITLNKLVNMIWISHKAIIWERISLQVENRHELVRDLRVRGV